MSSSPWGHKELDMTEHEHTHTHTHTQYHLHVQEFYKILKTSN